MGLFKKKKKEATDLKEGQLPDISQLSSLPELPPLPDIKEEGLSPLPALPSESKGLDNDIVKAAVSDDVFLREDFLKPRTREISGREAEMKFIMDRRTRELPTKFRVETPELLPPQQSFTVPSFAPSRRVNVVEEKEPGPIFVQIDKFENALSSFTDIKRKVSEIADMLKDVRSIREREEAELNEWEREIDTIKVRIDSIDNQIFKKLD